jgi:hypothetical protein
VKGGLEAIKQGTPSREAIVQTLLRPLQHVLRKFGETTMGEIAKLAVAKLIAWLFS